MTTYMENIGALKANLRRKVVIDMARYIDADALLKKLPNDLPYKASVKRVLMQAPEADVAPKSEIALNVIQIIDRKISNAKAILSSGVSTDLWEWYYKGIISACESLKDALGTKYKGGERNNER